MAPPRRRARRASAGHLAPRRGPGLHHAPRARRDPPGRAAAHGAGPDRARRAGHGGRGRLPVHPDNPRPVLSAVAAGTQAHQHPAGLPRLRHRRRPRRRPADRADRPAQGHRPDHLLLPARPPPAGRLQGQPEPRSHRLRRPLEEPHRPRPGAAHLRLQAHDPGCARRARRPPDRVHHPARPPPRPHQSPGRPARQRLGIPHPRAGREQDPPRRCRPIPARSASSPSPAWATTSPPC